MQAKSANKFFKKYETEFKPTQDQFDNIVVPTITGLNKYVKSHQVKFVTVSGIDYCKFVFVSDNVFGTYLLNACREKGYILKHKFVSDSIKVKRTRLTAKGENLIEKSDRGLITSTRDEILSEPGTQVVYEEVVNYLDPRKWDMSLSLPLAQSDYWKPWLISVLSVDAPPALNENETSKLEKQLAAVNKRIDSKVAEKKKRTPKKVVTKEIKGEKPIIKVFRIKKRGDNID